VVNIASTARTVTLTNTGTGPMTISSISLTGTNPADFTQTNTCGATLNAGANCVFTVTFKPTATGSRSASISIVDSAGGSPHTVPLTGAGTFVTVSPASLAFGNQRINTNSTAQTVTVTNAGATALTSVAITFTGTNLGDFSQTNNCGTSVAAGASCTINVTFRPTGLGSRSASLRIADSDATSPQLVTLTGTGTLF
jgi:hypothetical protein